ncbi:TraB/VirB10 family protein [bacterium]|nr:TraB/VirB10 family protein [bacterium]
MSIQQKASDMYQLVQRDRKAQVIAGCVVLAVLFLVFYQPKQRRRTAQPAFTVREQPADKIGAASAQEVYSDLQEVIVSRLDQQKEIMGQLQENQKNTEERIEENEMRTAEIFETLIKRIESQRPALPDYAADGVTGNPVSDSPAFPDEDPFSGDTLESFGEVADVGVVAPPELAEEDARIAYIAPTDFVRVKLLAGVNAPTDGTPYPVLLELVGDVQSPDGGNLPLGGARMLAAAQGSLVDSRALFRLTTLTMRLPNGELLDVSVDGWIVGEDGIRGMKGIPIDPLGKILGAGAINGFVQGAGNALSTGQVTTTVGNNGAISSALTGDALQFAAGRGISESARMWSDVIRQRVQQTVPAIQVYSGREATAIFSRGAEIPRLFEMLNTDEEDVFSGLD